MTELVTFGETPLRFSPADNQRLERIRTATIHADGTESNVACAAHELGADVTWLSKVPATPLGRRVVSQIRGRGIDADVAWADDGDARQGLVFGEPAEPPRESKHWHDRRHTAAASASPSEFPMDLVQNTDALFVGVGTSTLSQQAAETTQALVRASSGDETVTAVDIDYAPGLASPQTYRRRFEEMADDINVFFGNVDNIREVLGYSGTARELGNIIATEYDFDIVVVTRSELGAVAIHDSPGTNLYHEREAIDATPVDTAGQHAAFVGAFLSELITNAEVSRALTVAVATGALARTIEGPLLTTTDGEVERLADQIRDRSR